MSKQIVIKYKPSDYGGIDRVELNYSADAVWTNGELEDDYKDIADFLSKNRFLYNSVLECAFIMEHGEDIR